MSKLNKKNRPKYTCRCGSEHFLIYWVGTPEETEGVFQSPGVLALECGQCGALTYLTESYVSEWRTEYPDSGVISAAPLKAHISKMIQVG